MPETAKPEPTSSDVHQCLNAIYDGDGRTPFILSLDGGGVYGLTTAIWLRQLCEKARGFLVPGQVRVFAGCSSGAINCLLMAMHGSPREAVMSGELERFWKRVDVFSNRHPVTRWLGAGGLTAMFGTEDFLGALREEFGDMTLGDMKNRVLISTYNWTGASADEQHFGTPFDGSTIDWKALLPQHMFRMGQRAPLRTTRAGQTKNHWRPKFFDSHGLTTTDRDIKVADVAFAAACVPGLRSLRGGLGDGASFNANPSVSAIAHMLEQWEASVDHGLHMTDVPPGVGAELSPREQIRRILTEGLGKEPARSIAQWKKVDEEDRVADELLDDAEWVKTHGKGVVLGWMRMLSIGSGQALPALGYSNIDVGLNLWQQLPTNPFAGIVLPSPVFAVDAPATAAEFTCRRLLDDERAMRLNPDLMPIPTVMASMMAINPMLRAYITRMIYDKTASPKSKRAVDTAARFIEEQGSFGTGWYQKSQQEDAIRSLTVWREERAARAKQRRRQRWMST